MRKILWWIFIAAMLSVFCYSGWNLYSYWKEENTAGQTFDSITEIYQKAEEQTIPDIKPESSDTRPEETVEEITITVSWEVPEKPIEYRLEICLSGTKDILESKLVPPNTASTYVELTGSGSREYDLYIDGVYECTKLVDFN